MPYCTWLFAVTFGLILLPVLGQVQDEIDNEQGQATTKQEPAKAFSVPVHIVEDESEADARESSETETRQHNKDDLIAQQRMNAATQAMNEATQRMALYSLLSVCFVGVGIILLVWTLFETRKLARDTREIGEAQILAYISILAVGVKFNAREGMLHELKIFFEVKNSGNSPAKNVSVSVSVSVERLSV